MTRTHKELIFGACAALFQAAVFWLWFRETPRIVAGEFRAYIPFIMPVAGLVVSAILLSLVFLFVKNNPILYGTTVVAASVPYFFLSASGVVVGGLFASIVFLCLAAWRTQKEFTLSLGFSAAKILKTGLPLYFTVASLTVAFFFLSHVDEEKAVSSLLPKSLFELTFTSLGGTTRFFSNLPAVDPNGTVNDLLIKILGQELVAKGVSIERIPQSDLRRLLEAERGELTKFLGVALTGNEKIVDVFYSAVTSRVSDLLGPYKRFLPAASAVVFFFAFKALTLPLYYLTLFFTFLLIKILITFKILHREMQQVEVERITL